MQYCTQQDVLEVGRIFSFDFDSQLMDSSHFDYTITEATEYARQALRGRYTIATVEAIVPLPSTLVNLTKIKAAKLLFERFLYKTGNTSEDLASRMENMLCFWKKIISEGSMYDEVGNKIPTLNPPNSVVQPLTSKMQDMYRHGYRNYTFVPAVEFGGNTSVSIGSPFDDGI